MSNHPIQTVRIDGMTNAEFFQQFASAGRVGLVGGASWIDCAISAAQRRLDEGKEWSRWSHAFLLQGGRMDGHSWIIESDLDVHRKHIRLGVQENRLNKYFDDEQYPRVAVLDFGLGPEQTATVMRLALDMVADRVRYSIRELFGTMLALKKESWRAEENRLSRERSIFCSAFVRKVYQDAGLDLLPGVSVKNTAPEHLARSACVRGMWYVEREKPRRKLGLRSKK